MVGSRFLNGRSATIKIIAYCRAIYVDVNTHGLLKWQEMGCGIVLYFVE